MCDLLFAIHNMNILIPIPIYFMKIECRDAEIYTVDVLKGREPNLPQNSNDHIHHEYTQMHHMWINIHKETQTNNPRIK